MFKIVKKEINWGGKKLTLETGRMARQADGSVLATIGETVVLATIVFAKKAKEGVDFFPLTVHYVEKAFAAGKIPGGFFKREGRPSEKEVLTSRLIDRPIRPLFSENFFNETQIICTVLSHDLVNDPDIVALVAAGAAVAISGIPHHDTLAGARVGYIDGEYRLNPSLEEMATSALDLVVAGTKDSVFMVESEAKELSEEIMLGAVKFGQEKYREVINMIEEFAGEAGKDEFEFDDHIVSDEIKAEISNDAASSFAETYKIISKQERSKKLEAIRADVTAKFIEKGVDERKLAYILKGLEKDVVRGNILQTGLRIDGRDTKTVRPIRVEVDVLPRTHGSSLFTRGETQALVVTTLGTTQDEQIIDALEGESKARFMLHYNFPPYSVGESTPLRAPGRREVGHGKLAWRAINPLLPTKEQFPYTIRLVSEITESNGSSSMATVCGSSLALMDAGVPLPRPVAGIAMGLIKEADKFAVLTDILGDEDHLGDMDFKVAGTENGVTALQMDIKIKGITNEIMEIALAQAKDGRIHILGKMAEVISSAKTSLNRNAPTITTIKINKDKIREVIGSGGKVIREICEVSKAKVDIEDDGTIKIAATDAKSSEIALAMINNIVAEPEIGRIYDGKVTTIVDFGIFVNFIGALEGLVHISEIANTRVKDINEYVKLGDKVKVKVLGMEKGKVKLSMRVVNQETGEEISGGSEGGSGGDNAPKGEGSRSEGHRHEGQRDGGHKKKHHSGDRNDRGDRSERNHSKNDGDDRVERKKFF